MGILAHPRQATARMLNVLQVIALMVLSLAMALLGPQDLLRHTQKPPPLALKVTMELIMEKQNTQAVREIYQDQAGALVPEVMYGVQT